MPIANILPPLTDDVTMETDKVEEIIPETRPVYRATRTVFTDLIHTKLEVSFDWSKSQMKGVEYLTAKPHFYTSDSLILDAKGMQIDAVSLNNKPLTYTYSNDVLKIKLDRSYIASENYTVKINYIAKPEDRETGGSHAISSDKGLYFINPLGEDKTKMPQIWTQGETEANSVWFPTIDSPNSKTTQEIYMTVDNKYTTLSNGKLISSKVNGDGTRTDYWKQELPHAPYLFMMGVGEFKIVKDVYTRPNGTKMEVNYYVEPEWEKSAKAIFGETPEMIKYFSKLLGVEYPWDKYSQIVVRDYVSGAMENTGAVVFGDFVYQTDREMMDYNHQSTIAHELFHHWFGDLVTAESWSNLTLNESFADYSQYLWDEYRHGLDEAAYQAEGEADNYFQSGQMDGYHNLVWFNYEDKEDMFDAHSYQKGGRILHMLRNYLGDEAFFKGINVYLTKNKYTAAEFHQLRLAFEEVSGEDLNWFFNQWYLGSGHPILDINQVDDKEASTVKVTIGQSQNLDLSPLFKLPMHIAVYDDEGKHVHKVVVDALTNEFVLPYKGKLSCVIVDDQQMLLGKIRQEKPIDQYVNQYYLAKNYKARKEGFMKGSTIQNKNPEQLILDALKDKFWHIRSLAIERCGNLKDESKAKMVELIKTMAVSDSNSSVRTQALYFLEDNLPKEDAERLFIDRMENDKSYLVVYSALVGLGKVNPVTAMSKAKNLENEKSAQVQVAIAQIYGANGGEDVYPYFESAFKSNYFDGYNKIDLLNSFTSYIIRQKIELIEKAFPLYENIDNAGNFYFKMFFSQFIGDVQGAINDRMDLVDKELKGAEANNNEASAAALRKQYDYMEQIKLKYASLLSN